jgi:hypothetical protein
VAFFFVEEIAMITLAWVPMHTKCYWRMGENAGKKRKCRGNNM